MRFPVDVINVVGNQICQQGIGRSYLKAVCLRRIYDARFVTRPYAARRHVYRRIDYVISARGVPERCIGRCISVTADVRVLIDSATAAVDEYDRDRTRARLTVYDEAAAWSVTQSFIGAAT